MLLKRIAKNNLRGKIKSYIDIKKYETLPENLASKKAFEHKSKEELLNDLTFYVEYCLNNTVNPDEDYTKLLESLLERCKKKDTKSLQDFLDKLNDRT